MYFHSEYYQRGWAEIDLDAIIHNLNLMKEKISEKTKIISVVKADGYGHGSVSIAKEIEKFNFLYGFAVATVNEAIELRKHGIYKPILLLGHVFAESYEQVIENNITITLFKERGALELNQIARKHNKILKVHIKIDTGMGRIGIPPTKEGLLKVKTISDMECLEIEGIYTHFACADEIDKSFTKAQIDLFDKFTKEIESILDFQIPFKHCSNSAGILEMKEGNFDLVRGGIIQYGLWPSDEIKKSNIDLRPALSLKSHLIYIKQVEAGTTISYGKTFVANKTMIIGTVPLGYGDGYPRSLSNIGYVLIGGKKAKILGRICMDQFMVDVTEIKGVQEGDLVTLIGRDGSEIITMEELGSLSERFNYEFACCISKRVPRIYIHGK